MLLKTSEEKIVSARDVANIFRNILLAEDEIDRQKEHFWVAGLSSSNQILYIELVTLGLLDQALTHARETYRMAIMKAASKIMAVHNHPSGKIIPSEQDKKTCKNLSDAGKILEIKLLDFLIISENNERYWAASEEGIL